MNWDTKRKVLYALSVAVVLIGVTFFMLRDTIFPAPSCIDHKQNGYESGVDCGGTCALVCTQDVSPLKVVWSKAVPLGGKLYDLVALITNANINNASTELGYRVIVYDKSAIPIKIFNGSTTAPLDGKFPIIISNVPLDVAPANVVVKLTDGPHFTVKESPKAPTLRVMDRHFEGGDISRVYATLMNTKRLEINNLQVRVLLYDANDNVYAVGETVIPFIPKEGIKEVVFTWHNPLPKSPTRIEVYPIFNPFEAIDY